MKKSNKEEPKDTKSKALLKANEFIYSELNGMDRYISLNDNRYTVTYGTADQEMHRHFPFENTEKEIDSNVLECEYLTQKDYVVTMSHTTDGWTLGLPAYHVTRSSDLKCTVQADTLREAMKKLKLLQRIGLDTRFPFFSCIGLEKYLFKIC